MRSTNKHVLRLRGLLRQIDVTYYPSDKLDLLDRIRRLCDFMSKHPHVTLPDADSTGKNRDPHSILEHHVHQLQDIKDHLVDVRNHRSIEVERLNIAQDSKLCHTAYRVYLYLVHTSS